MLPLPARLNDMKIRRKPVADRCNNQQIRITFACSVLKRTESDILRISCNSMVRRLIFHRSSYRNGRKPTAKSILRSQQFISRMNNPQLHFPAGSRKQDFIILGINQRLIFQNIDIAIRKSSVRNDFRQNAIVFTSAYEQ